LLTAKRPALTREAEEDQGGGKRRAYARVKTDHHGSPNSSAAMTSPFAVFTEWSC
jgi:hypothetical protein